MCAKRIALKNIIVSGNGFFAEYYFPFAGLSPSLSRNMFKVVVVVVVVVVIAAAVVVGVVGAGVVAGAVAPAPAAAAVLVVAVAVGVAGVVVRSSRQAAKADSKSWACAMAFKRRGFFRGVFRATLSDLSR